MKEKMGGFAKTVLSTIWSGTKSPLGLTIIGGLSGATATHLFTKSKNVRDLEQAQSDCNKLQDEILKLQELNTRLSNRNDELRDELRKIDRGFSDCKYLVHATTSAYRNSWCFWRVQVDTFHGSSDMTTGKSPTTSSKLTNRE
ncbi:MAG: hypothetical protein AB7F64_00085 [Gammaproteobacteria bacterium]